MKRFLLVASLLAGLGYFASPVFALWQLSRAVAARDAAALAERVDFERLGASLSRQIAGRYLALTGQDKRISPLARTLAVGFSASIADPLVAEFVNPQGLISLLDQGWPSTIPATASANSPTLGATDLPGILSAIGSADVGLRTFALSLPSNEPDARRYTLHMRLVSWRWKLVGIGLPDDIELRFAEALAKRRSTKG